MRVVAFRHVPFEGLGLIEGVLDGLGIGVEYADLYRHGASMPDVSTAAGLIVMGGPMSANDDLPYLRSEIDFLRTATGRAQPVLGICLGAQLLARSLGAKVYRNAVKEIGWFDLHLTEPGRQDRLLSSMRPTETVFHWHGETFDLPPGAVWLAQSEACRNQAFRVGEQCYGLQFHLEVTPAMIADWCEQDVNCGDMREVEAPIDPNHNAVRLRELSTYVFGSWCSLLR